MDTYHLRAMWNIFSVFTWAFSCTSKTLSYELYSSSFLSPHVLLQCPPFLLADILNSPNLENKTPYPPINRFDIYPTEFESCLHTEISQFSYSCNFSHIFTCVCIALFSWITWNNMRTGYAHNWCRFLRNARLGFKTLNYFLIIFNNNFN